MNYVKYLTILLLFFSTAVLGQADWVNYQYISHNQETYWDGALDQVFKTEAFIMVKDDYHTLEVRGVSFNFELAIDLNIEETQRFNAEGVSGLFFDTDYEEIKVLLHEEINMLTIFLCGETLKIYILY